MRHGEITAITFAILSGALVCMVSAEPNAKASQSDQGWFQNGTNRVEMPNMKSSKGFGASLCLTDDTQFFDDWNKESPGVKIKEMKRATRNKPFFTVVIFVNPSTDSKKQCNVTGDITIRKPDGTVYGAMTNANFWVALPAPKPGELQLAVEYMGTVIEKKDPPGKYSVEVIVRDNIKKAEISLSDSFVVEKDK